MVGENWFWEFNDLTSFNRLLIKLNLEQQEGVRIKTGRGYLCCPTDDLVILLNS